MMFYGASARFTRLWFSASATSRFSGVLAHLKALHCGTHAHDNWDADELLRLTARFGRASDIDDRRVWRDRLVNCSKTAIC